MLGDDLIEQLAPVDEIVDRLPRPLDPDETNRLEHLISDAVDELVVAFSDAGRNLEAELDRETPPTPPVLRHKVGWAIREMVSAAVLIGPHTGMRSVSSSTGPQSDSVTFADVGSSTWAGVSLTDHVRRRLGLPVGDSPRFRFPRPPRWPEVMADEQRWW